MKNDRVTFVSLMDGDGNNGAGCGRGSDERRRKFGNCSRLP